MNRTDWAEGKPRPHFRLPQSGDIYADTKDESRYILLTHTPLDDKDNYLYFVWRDNDRDDKQAVKDIQDKFANPESVAHFDWTRIKIKEIVKDFRLMYQHEQN